MRAFLGGAMGGPRGRPSPAVGGAASPASAPNPPFAYTSLTAGSGQFIPFFSDPLTNADGSAIGTITARTCYYSATEGVARELGGTAVACTSGVAVTGVSAGLKYVIETVTTAAGESYASNELSVTVT